LRHFGIPLPPYKYINNILQQVLFKYILTHLLVPPQKQKRLVSFRICMGEIQNKNLTVTLVREAVLFGGLPWGNAWRKLNGSFYRVASEETE